MSFTLIVTGRGRRKEIDRLFQSVFAQSLSKDVEVLFVDQGHPDEKYGIPFAPVSRYQVWHTGLLSLSAARNLALPSSTGDIIAFPDDDCWYPPDLLENVTDYFVNHPAVDCLCTTIVDPSSGRLYGGRPLKREIAIGYSNLYRLPSSAGMFVRRQAMESVGATFNEHLGAGAFYGSGEDTELVSRLLDAGCIVRYNGYLQVYHPLPDYDEADVEKYFNYGRGFGYVNALTLKGGHPAVLGCLIEIMTRSLFGSIVNLRHSLLRRLYWRRFQGIFLGLWEGLQTP